MKKILFLTLFAIVATGGFGQREDKAITKKLKKIYDYVQYYYSNEYDGWYSIRKGDVGCKECQGACNERGNEVIPPIYDEVSPKYICYETPYIVKLNGKVAIRDSNNKELLPFKYDNVERYENCYVKVELNGKFGIVEANTFGIIDKQYNEIVAPKYDKISYDYPFEHYFKVELNGKVGVIDELGNEIAAPKYDEINSLTFTEYNPYVKVKLNGKVGVIDKQGNEIIPPIWDNLYYNDINSSDIFCNITVIKKKDYFKVRISVKTLNVFAKDYVQTRINEWQKKGDFEKTTDWQNRVTETTRKTKAAELLKQAEQEYMALYTKDFSLYQILGDYDPDNEVFLIEDVQYGNLLVPVPLDKAQSFKADWKNIKKTPKYFIENDKLALAEIVFTTGGKSYTYSNKASLNYSITNIDYNFDPINVNIADNSNSNAQKGKQNISTVNLNVGKDEVDINVPSGGTKSEKTFAVIIANENYQRESQVIFAKNDGETFKRYCLQTLGLPEKNIRFAADATLNNIRAEINWVSNVAKAYKDEANIIFYYAGHGIPDESTKTAYLLPIDGYGSDVTTGYKLDDLYSKLGALPVRNITVFMDACFSGAQRSGEMLASTRGVAIKTEKSKPSGNMVVFSAAQSDETAYPYREKGHGLFTYFLLKKLQETKGNVTLGELSSYITTNVQQQSIVVNSKSQTPTVIPSASLDNWQNMKLK